MDDRARLARDLLTYLDRPGASALTLLDEYPSLSPAYRRIWEEHPELYQGFTERLIREGHSARALDLAQERRDYLHHHPPPGPPNPVPEGYQLRYALALAAARGGNPGYAEQLIQPLLTLARRPDDEVAGMPVKLRVDVVAMLGRVMKVRSRRDPSLFALSAMAYEDASNVPGAKAQADRGTYPLINAATMWRLAAEHERSLGSARAAEYAERSKALAFEVIERGEPLVAAAVEANDYWLPASFGEANILAGRHEVGGEWIVRAVGMARAQNRIGDIVAIRTNIGLLAEYHVTQDPAWIAEHIGSLVVFSGHMVDSPEHITRGRPPRFPNVRPLVDRVRRVIGERLQALNATVGYCSLACGSDILFAEAMLDRAAELHVVLPFAEADFLRTSVHFGLPDDPSLGAWRRQFDEVLKKLPTDRLHHATTEGHLGTEALFDFANTFIQGLAVLRARERVVVPRAVIVLDPEPQAAVGGAQHFRDMWEAAGLASDVIDLTAVRAETPAAAVSAPAEAAVLDEIPERPVKALLFADVAGFSGVPEHWLPRFLRQYAAFLRRAFATESGRGRRFANTWGDGLYVVFDEVPAAAEFALTLLEQAAKPEADGGVDWASFGMGDSAPLRVALHCGPVFAVPDAISDRPSYFGQHVNRAARIEPVTVRGCVYASEQFAAHLTMSARAGEKPRFLCESVGIRTLPKGYDRCPLYHITRA